MTTSYQTAAQLFDRWRDDLLSGNPPLLYRCGDGALAGLQLGPGLVTLIGGPPGAGKTAFTMQVAVDALRLNPELKVLVANVEVSPGVLLNRQLSRIGGLPYERVRMRELTPEDGERAELAFNTLEQISERLAFLRAPFDLAKIASAADAHCAGLVLLDYVQRIKPPGDHDRRGSVDALMSYLRQFADEGVAVIAVSSVGRQKDKKGRSSYSGESLNLASFRESSELEFGADDAYMLTAADDAGIAHLRHLKARHSEPQNLMLQFRGRFQQFEPVAEIQGPLSPALCDLWNQAKPACSVEEVQS